MSNVSAVVNTETDRDDEVDAADSVDGEAPEVNETKNISLMFLKISRIQLTDPPTLTRVRRTQTRTMTQAGRFWMRTRVVMKTQRRERPMFLQNSSSITSSVSQLAYSLPTGNALLEKLASATICLTLFMAGIHSDGPLNSL